MKTYFPLTEHWGGSSKILNLTNLNREEIIKKLKSLNKSSFNIPSKKKGNNDFSLAYNLLIDNLITISKKIITLQDDKIVAQYDLYEYNKKINCFFDKLKIKNCNIRKNRSFDIDIEYSCDKNHYLKNVNDEIIPFDFLCLDENSFIFNLIKIKFRPSNEFSVKYCFELLLGKEKFMKEIKNIEKIFKNKDLKDLYTQFSYNANLELEINSKIHDLENEFEHTEDKIKYIMVVSELTSGIIFTSYNKKYKINRINFENETIYFDDGNTMSSEAYFLRRKTNDVFFDVQAERSVKYNKINNIING